MIASELVAAIFIADFPKYEKVVLAEILLGQYGPQKLKGVLIDPATVAGRIGVDPRMIRRAVKSVTAKGVASERPDGSLTFVKDWEKWVLDGRADLASDPFNRLLGDGERRFVAYAATRFSPQVPSRRKRKQGTKECRTDQPDRHKEGTNESPAPTTRGTIQSPARPTRGTIQSPFDGGTNSVKVGASPDPETPPTLPLTRAGARPSEDLILERELTLSKKRELTLSQNSREGDDEFEPFMSPPDPPKVPAPRDPATDALHDYMLKATATAEYPGGREDMADHAVAEFAAWVGQGYSVAVVKAAIHKAVKNGVARDALAFSRYVQAILNRDAADRRARPPAPAAPPDLAGAGFGFDAPPPRPGKAQRDAAESERQREAFRLNRLRKEAANGQG